MIVFVFIYEGTKYGEKVLTIVMSVAMVLCLLPTAVMAETEEPTLWIRCGTSTTLTVTLPTTDNSYTYGTTGADGKTASQTASNEAALPDSGWTWAVQKVDTVDAGTTYGYKMILNNFNADTRDRVSGGTDYDCIRFQSMNLSVVIIGTNTLNISTKRGTGIISEEGTGSKLLISGSGTLNTSGAIGISTYQGITINSGTINASSAESWGVGSLGKITINGGNVTSNGARCGIRSADSGYHFPIGIIINGGTVTAKAGVGNSAFNINPTMTDYAGGYRWNINQDTPVWTRSDVTAFTNEDGPVYVQIKSIMLTDSDDFDVPTGMVSTDITPIDVSGGLIDGQAPYTFSLENAPSWLSISDAGVISGSRPATASEATTATVKVVDSSIPALSDSITINIGAITAKPVSPSDNKPVSDSNPSTSDNNMIELWIGLALLAAFVFMVSVIISRRNRKA